MPTYVDTFAILAALLLLVGALMQAFSSIRSMNKADVDLFLAHSALEKDQIELRRSEVMRARWWKRRRLAREARLEVKASLSADERERLRIINLSLIGWSVIVVGSVAGVVSTIASIAF